MRKIYGAHVLASTVGMSEDEWLEVRRNGIGGSDVGAILGISKYASPLSIWLSKVEGFSKKAGRAAHRGKMSESWIRDEAAARNGWRVRQVHAVLQHPERKWMLANIDGVITNLGKKHEILEIKFINSSHVASKVLDNNKPLDEHLAQVAWYLAVTGLDRGHIVYDLPSHDPLDFVVDRDLDLESDMIAAALSFWSLVESKEAPALDGSVDASDYLKIKFSDATDTTIQLPESCEQYVMEYQAASDGIKELETVKERAKQMLEESLGQNTTGYAGSKVVSWKPTSSKRIDTDMLKKKYPEIAAECTAESTYRRFLIKG